MNVLNIQELDKKFDEELKIYICDADEHLLDPMEQIEYALNEVQVTYGSIVKLRDAP